MGFIRQVLPTCSLLLVLKERLWVLFVRFYRPAGPEEKSSADEIPNGAWLVSPAVEYRTHTQNLNFLPSLNPVVGQNIALHASPAARISHV